MATGTKDATRIQRYMQVWKRCDKDSDVDRTRFNCGRTVVECIQKIYGIELQEWYKRCRTTRTKDAKVYRKERK